MEISSLALEDIQWWIVNIPSSNYVISHGDPQITLYTDASTTGWGCDLEGTPTGGCWSSAEAQNHINYLEMLAIKLALESFEEEVKQKHVKLMVDNMTALTILNNMGTSRSWKLNELNKDIWDWCIVRGIWLTAVHIPGVNNSIADRESRLNRREIEWTLNQELFDAGINRLLVHPDIDLFASRLNYQLKPYVSFKPDPGALAVDAFTLQWSRYLFYAFPPFSMIMRTLQKIHQDQATGLLVVPFWPTQAWWPVLTKMLIKEPLVIPSRKNTLILHQDPKAVHPLSKQMLLLLCPLSGNTYKAKEFLHQLHIIMQSWRTSTRVQYRSYIKKWTAYCCKWKIDPVSPPIASGVNFLAELYNQGLRYSALNTARSALSSIISLQGNFSFGNHPLVSRFLKGTFTIRPAMPKYNEVWDVNEVLKHLQTLQPLK